MHVGDDDNCVTLTEAASEGDEVSFLMDGAAQVVTSRGHIPIWHKMAVSTVKKGGKVLKYGAVIGIAKEDIGAGEHVHTHNIRSPGYEVGPDE